MNKLKSSMSVDDTHESTKISFSNKESIEARQQIFEEMESYSATKEEKERSLGLFLRGSLLARILGIVEIYKQIVNLPGMIFDIGTWRGQTAVLCENLRSIYEPLHFNRRIVCFDTFEGYQGFSDKDKSTQIHRNGTYALEGAQYAEFLENLLKLHEKSNAMGHYNGKHTVIAGDCRSTIPAYFKDVPNSCIALAFFDINSYDPTAKAFEAIWERVVPQGIVAFWQLTTACIPAEGMFYNQQILNKFPHKIERCSTYPSLSYIVKS